LKRYSREQRNAGQGSASHRWIGRTYIAVPYFGLLFSD